MFELLPLAETAQLGNDVIVGPAGVNYPWGESAADEMLVAAIYGLGRKWLDAHYDSERMDLIDTVVDNVD